VQPNVTSPADSSAEAWLKEFVIISFESGAIAIASFASNCNRSWAVRQRSAHFYRRSNARQFATRFAFSRFGVQALRPLMGGLREKGLLCRLKGLQDTQSMLAVRCMLLDTS
jgi:hypothetical protein